MGDEQKLVDEIRSLARNSGAAKDRRTARGRRRRANTLQHLPQPTPFQRRMTIPPKFASSSARNSKRSKRAIRKSA